jgi:segregation and condensation protein B
MLNINNKDLPLIIEALLLAANNPMSIQDIMLIFDEIERPTAKEIETAIALLQQPKEPRGIELVKVANGYQFQSKQKFAHLVARLWQEKPAKYSRAFLETLALIAYRQPITRGEIEQIRGVTISQSIFKTLQEERGWIRVIGHKDVPGKPGLYATTKEFLTYFGLEKLEQLPPLPQVMEFLTAE